ncbi:MFS transporter [Corynebacterium glutamicum]|uniref:MFS transporter n=1 Tax=Corynebacterium glutamicum TaxID=1718 RepID=UPI001B8D65C8|nr:MFS transporter [Corynebacterium glutamicum]
MSLRPTDTRADNASPSDTNQTPEGTHARKAATASFIGSTLEYYDFFIYGSASALVFNRIFFPDIDPFIGTILSMATIGIGYVVRPIAAMVIGHFGDRVGRKQMLVLTLVMMGVSTFLIGCLPTPATIGVLAPVLLVLLRVMQGISAAGESVGAVTISLEHAPSHKRAFYASWVNTGAVAGILLASLAFMLVALLPDEQLLSWGWRIPFLASIVVAILGLYIRATLPDAEVFQKGKEEETGQIELPLKVVFRDHWRTVIKVIAFGLWAVISSIFSAFSLSYATGEPGIPASLMLLVTITTALCGIISQPLFGMLADKIGRKPVFIMGNLICAITIFVYFGAISAANIPLIFLSGIIVMSVGYGMVNPLGPAMTAEMFPTKIRYSGAATASQLGLVVTGFAPTIAAILIRPGPTGWVPVAVFTAGCCLIAAFVTLVWVKETYKIHTEDLGK